MDLTKVLGAVPLFGELDPLELAALAGITTSHALGRNQPLVVEGAPVPALWVIVSGKVAVMKRRGESADHLCDLGAGECVGELEIVDGSPCSASVVPYGDVEALRIAKEAFEVFMAARPTTAVKILRRLVGVLSQRLRQTNTNYSSLKGIADAMDG